MEKYYTHSRNLAAYLVMHGFEIIEIANEKNDATIYFEKSDAIHDCVRKYNTEKELKSFIAAFTKVNKKIYTTKK